MAMQHDMDMGMSSTASSMATPTSSGIASTTSASMDMEMDMGGGCIISMLWNWETIDTCFLAESWENNTTAKFAGSCIGVVLLTVALEFLRRLSKEYDRYLVRQHADQARDSASTARTGWAGRSGAGFFPNVVQQAIRALLHMVTFAVAYFVMLLAMYFNGYIIICIFIGAFIGAFLFSWEPIIGASSSKNTSANETTVCCG